MPAVRPAWMPPVCRRAHARRRCHVNTACLSICLALTMVVVSAVEPQQTAVLKGPRKRFALNNATAWQIRCVFSKGDWCKEFHLQQPVQWKPAPRGSKQCPKDCNGVGVCNADTGICMCPAGWAGEDCATRQFRPCTNRNSDCDKDDWSQGPISHVDQHGRDVDPMASGRTESRCSGVCDMDIGACYCDGYVPPPVGSPPGTPPINRTRQLNGGEFQLKNDRTGKLLGFHGERTWDQLYGEQGWCTAAKPTTQLPCILDGTTGMYCDEYVETFCINQCSGRGACYLGFCYCDKGWYGTDCSLQAAGQESERVWRLIESPHLTKVVLQPPAAADPPPAPTRKRPLIYIYDLDPLFNQKLLQYRIAGTWCTHRKWGSGNSTAEVPNWGYSVEQLFHETLVQSVHRTYDPEEADFFYVPYYSSCLIYPVRNQADFPRFAAAEGPRVSDAAMAAIEVYKYIDSRFPYWKRRQGRDHIWMFSHDEGACWAPNVVVNSTWLTHWGRLDVNHTSNTAFQPDNYNVDKVCKMQPEGWTKFIKGHACYNPIKDLVIPGQRTKEQYHSSPLMGRSPKPRNMLLFFRGDVGLHREPNYSRGIRQTLYRLSKEQKWKEKYKIVINDMQGDYSQLLSSSVFCLVAPGDGWSPRLEDSILHGCIPVIIKDGVDDVFETMLDYTKFTVRIAESDVSKTADILTSITTAQIAVMQQNLARVWHRFRYAAARCQSETTQGVLEQNLAHHDQEMSQQRQAQGNEAMAPVKLYPRPFRGDVTTDDAFSTIMQWLFSRIKDTR